MGQIKTLTKKFTLCAAAIALLTISSHVYSMYEGEESEKQSSSALKLKEKLANGIPSLELEALVSDTEVSDWKAVESIRLVHTEKDPVRYYRMSLLKSFSNLHILSLRDCEDVWDECIKILVMDHPNLTEVYLNKTKISNWSVSALAHENLSVLNLNHCPHITGDALNIVAEQCPKLTVLAVAECESVKNDHIIAIAEKCHELTQLNLNGCYMITDKSIQAIATHCPKLKVLVLNACDQITDEAVSAIVRGCSELEILVVSRCRFITDKSISMLVEHSKNLTVLHICKCPSITNEGKKNIPKLSCLQELVLESGKVLDGEELERCLKSLAK